MSAHFEPPKPTRLDRALAHVFPNWALRRFSARLKLAATKAYYDGATTGRRGASIRRSTADANTIGYAQSARLRAGVRDLIRNNAHARRAVEAIVSNTVGEGISPNFVRGPVGSGSRADDIEDLAAESLHTTAIDSDGLLTYAGIQALAMQAVASDGEVFVRRRRRRSSDGLRVPVQFQLLEADYLDTARDGPTPGGGRILQGIEFDALGRRRAYWMYRDHPGSRHFRADSRPVPASEVAHVYRVDRPGQVRGIPWGAVVMLAHADFGDHEEAELMRRKIASCFAMFYHETFDTSLPGSVRENDAGELIDSLEPGLVYRLPQGSEITFGNPPTVEGYAEFSSVSLHKIAMGWGVSYEAMTGDLRGVNFSSGKMGRLEFQRNIDQWRSRMLVPQLCDVLTDWWLEAAMLVGANTEGVRAQHNAPRNAMVDPTKEWRAERDAIRAGQRTLFQSIRESGRDPAEHLREIAEGQEMLDELGIVLDSDPRHRTAAGNDVGDAGGGSSAAPDIDDDLAEAIADRMLMAGNGSR